MIHRYNQKVTKVEQNSVELIFNYFLLTLFDGIDISCNLPFFDPRCAMSHGYIYAVRSKSSVDHKSLCTNLKCISIDLIDLVGF